LVESNIPQSNHTT